MSGEQHTVIFVLCTECDELDTLIYLEHSKVSKQTQMIYDHVEDMTVQHRDETGHRSKIVARQDHPYHAESYAQRVAEHIDSVDADFVTEEA